MKTIFIHHHLGLGDHLICNGLVRHFAENNKVNLFCKNQNMYNISVMFADNKNISLIGVNSDQDIASYDLSKGNYLKIGIALNSNFDYNKANYFWDSVFYEQSNLEFDLSWSLFKYNKPSTQQKLPDKPYAFICNKGSDGINGIDYSSVDNNLEKVYSDNGYFFDNIDLIINATEIHTINSAYIHLIDRMNNINTDKLFYHKNFVKKPYSNFTRNKRWVVI